MLNLGSPGKVPDTVFWPKLDTVGYIKFRCGTKLNFAAALNFAAVSARRARRL